jgi:Sulfotransferase family
LPYNFRSAGLIHLALPNARIIHSVRDPRDTCISCFSTLFIGASQPYSYELGELGRYYRAYRQLMDHWRVVLPPTVMLEVNYEDIVEDLEGEVRRILGSPARMNSSNGSHAAMRQYSRKMPKTFLAVRSSD